MSKVKENEVIKFEKEEIEKIENFRKEFSEVTARLGEVEIELTLIETQKTNIENFKAQLKQKYLEMREAEIKLAGELKEKYGEGEFDIKTGIFTPNV